MTDIVTPIEGYTGALLRVSIIRALRFSTLEVPVGYEVAIAEDGAKVVIVHSKAVIFKDFFLRRAIKQALKIFKTIKNYSGPVFVKHGDV